MDTERVEVTVVFTVIKNSSTLHIATDDFVAGAISAIENQFDGYEPEIVEATVRDEGVEPGLQPRTDDALRKIANKELNKRASQRDNVLRIGQKLTEG
jgi:hypothetical protein